MRSIMEAQREKSRDPIVPLLSLPWRRRSSRAAGVELLEAIGVASFDAFPDERELKP
jgi:hypothetical protein